MPLPELPDIPLLPPLCVIQHDETTCTFLGITFNCLPSYDPDGMFAGGAQLGHWWTFVLLVIIGLVNFSYCDFPLSRNDTMKITTSFYSVITGFFALMRLNLGLGKPLLIGAALHNLAEWSIVCQIDARLKRRYDISRNLTYSTFWILFVVASIMMMPTIPWAILIEQATGIMLDFALLFMLNKAYWIDNKSFYLLPMIAHTVHLFFTILPLVYANFFVGETSYFSPFFLELAVYFSAPVTHILDFFWSQEFDKKAREDQTIPEKEKISGTWMYLIAGFLVGLVVLLGSPALLGFCAVNPVCEQSPIITGTSVAQVHPGFGLAFEDLIKVHGLEEKAKAQDGNLFYEIVKDVQDPNRYRVNEKWRDMAALEAWLAGFPHTFFHSPEMKTLLVGEALQDMAGHIYPIPLECNHRAYGAVSADVGADCSEVWTVISNLSDCRWVIGCEYATVLQQEGGGLRWKLRMNDGNTAERIVRKLTSNPRELVYEMVVGNYVGTVNALSPKEGGSGCTLAYRFDVPKEKESLVPVVLNDFLQNRVPELKKLFQ